jgi:hypothetical protein
MSYNENYHARKWSEREDLSDDFEAYMRKYKKKQENQQKKLRSKILKESSYRTWWESLTEAQQVQVIDYYRGGDVKMFLRHISLKVVPETATYRKNKIKNIL